MLRKTSKRISIPFVLCIMLFTCLLHAQAGDIAIHDGRLVPRILNYQGYLTDTFDIPIDDTLDMTFKVFDAASSGNELWSETQTNVPIEHGVFSVILGGTTPIPDSVFADFTSTWLELTLEGPQTLTPRTRVTSVGYAYTSTYSDTAEYAKVGVDNDWNISGNRMYPSGDYGLSLRSGNVMHGTGDSTHMNFGIACTTGTSGQNYKYCKVGGGRYNAAKGAYSAICGGNDNRVLYDGGFIGGGSNNEVAHDRGIICGGISNTVSGYDAFLGGGSVNDINNAEYATLVGGVSNECYSAIGGLLSGYVNIAGNNHDDTCAVVAGGGYNTVYSKYSFIGTGRDNTCSGYFSFIGSGYNNDAGDGLDDTCAVVVSAFNSTALAPYAFIGGGKDNSSRRNFGVVVGGYADSVISTGGAILGGYLNKAGDASADSCVLVVGGYNNEAENTYSFIGGGNNNLSRGDYSIIVGGRNNYAENQYTTIAGGIYNGVDSDYGTISGGRENSVGGDYGVVAGGYANYAADERTFVGGGYSNNAYGSQSTISGGRLNRTWSAYGTIPGGLHDTVDAYCGFATNNSAKVLSTHDNSAAFTTSHTTAANQIRAAAFSTGTLMFSMDHPTDPMNKILNQHAVGSDQAMLMYSGSVILDANGRAVVHLPDYFAQINRNPRIQLTGVGSSDVYVAEDINGNIFLIGGKPDMKVYWEVTGERTDIHAEIARIQTPVEQQKIDDLIGHSLDDDALIGVYDNLENTKPGYFKFQTDEGRRVHEDSKRK